MIIMAKEFTESLLLNQAKKYLKHDGVVFKLSILIGVKEDGTTYKAKILSIDWQTQMFAHFVN